MQTRQYRVLSFLKVELWVDKLITAIFILLIRAKIDFRFDIQYEKPNLLMLETTIFSVFQYLWSYRRYSDRG